MLDLLTIDEMHQIAKKHGGRCLSKKYINSKAKISWECQLKHTWEATPNQIKRGSWCPVCGKKKCNEGRKLGTEMMRSIARKRGGKCISDIYVNNNTKLLWECAKGHRWGATPGGIRNGNWCKKCSGLEKGTIDEMREIAKERGGKCISNKYVNSRTKLLWECAKGHRWESEPASIKRGQWCPYCGGTAKLTIEEMKNIAKDRGGKCLSTAYVNFQTKLLWECAKGHQWKATPGSIKGGSWCPECKTGLGERICREYFQHIFKAKFPKCRPDWMRSEKKYKMELDGYCEDLEIAFEHHGQEHYEIKNYTIKSQKELNERKAKDKLKHELCEKHNVNLIEIPEVPTLISIINLKSFIGRECKKRKINLPEDFEQMKIDLKDAYVSYHSENMLKELRDIAKSKGGKCLSEEYINIETEMLWQCANNHQWSAPGVRIKSGYWCPHCAGNVRLTIADMKKMAKERGGKCLSKSYKNSGTKLLWECSQGHQWKATPGSVRNGGRWCKKCAGLERLTIDEMRKMAKERGGKCLSEEYINKETKLLWECANGHQWEATPGSIRNGKWCRICSNNKRKLTIEEMRTLAKKRGGRCLSDTYSLNEKDPGPYFTGIWGRYLLMKMQ